jgi:serine/threonine protein kinase
MWVRNLLNSRASTPVAPSEAISSDAVSGEVSKPLRMDEAMLNEHDATQRSAGVAGPPVGDALDETETRSDRVAFSLLPGDLPRAGQVVDDTYRIMSEIGRGAMGVVFSAFDQKLERTVAIKLIRGELLDSGFRSRFMHEARVMAQINHPNVVCIHALGDYGSMPYFVMELVEGTNLEQMQRKGGLLDIDVSVKILDDVCLGISAIHAAGAVHRDVKPSNILLDAQLRGKVADFGVSAHSVGVAGAEVVGTPGYMPPEAFHVGDKPTRPLPQSDVYSLGCIAYELFTGNHPFRRKGEPLWTAVPGRSDTVIAPSKLRPELTNALDRVLLQALETDLERRTPSVEAFRRGLLDAFQTDTLLERIVVAEDDEEFRDLIEMRLKEEFPGAEIECVGNGVDALAAFDRKPASAALIDLQMPAMDGVALTEHLRTREDCRSMPIIVLTASGGAREWQRLSTIGADRFLVKPIQLDDVVTFLRQAVRERGRKDMGSTRAAALKGHSTR